MSDSLIDCEAGRRLGCGTYCCRLLVRLDENERQPTTDGSTPKGCIDKDPDGLCIHLDRNSHRCRNWEKRPRVCREYDCNHDPMLQAAIQRGVKNIVQLSRDCLALKLAREDWVTVPGCEFASETASGEEG